MLQLRSPDLPGLHDADVGRNALPGVRGRDHEGAQGTRKRDEPHVRAPADVDRPADLVGHADADRGQRDRVPLGGRRRAPARWRLQRHVSVPVLPRRAARALHHARLHQYWRLLTSGFLHESIIHIGFNMLSLWFVGRSLEPAIGKVYFAAIYFTALLAGSFGALLFTPGAPTLGASGAIFGIFGALIMVARARRIPLWQTGLLPILLINLVYTLSVTGVSIGGHLGGVLSGFITGWLVTEYGEKRDKRSYVLLGCLAIAILSVDRLDRRRRRHRDPARRLVSRL